MMFYKRLKPLLISFTALAFSFCLLLALFVSSTAEAAPLNFKRPRATFAMGIDVFDSFWGDFGDAADMGLAVYADTTLQLGYFAGNLRLGLGRAFTKKSDLPFDNGYEYVYLTAAPRFYLAPFQKLYLYFYVQPEVSLHVLLSNTLVGITGNRSFTGAAGGSVGTQFILGVLSISGQVSCQYNWNLKAVIVSGGISIGITSTIP